MIKRLLVIGIALVLLTACGLLGSDQEPASPDSLPTLAIEAEPTDSPAGEGTPEPGSPRESEADRGHGLPPTFTPPAQEFVSGAPTSAAVPGAIAGSSGDGRTHVVQRGETLGTIAAQYGVSLDDLIQANRRDIKDKDLIYPGQILEIP